MKEMVGGCCVCSDERGFYENPLVYCDGQGCNVAVHQACYGIVSVPTGPWYCRKCESQERQARVRCELCPSKDGALKRTDSQSWAHVVCALYIPEVRFGNNNTMEPIILQLVPPERYSRTCYLCEEHGKEAKAHTGACMQCNKQGCKHYFHVTCAQAAGLLCEEAGNNMDNVKYCGYCSHHYQKLKKEGNIKPIPAFKPIPNDNSTPESSPEKFSTLKGQSLQNMTYPSESKHPKKKTAKTGSISSNASMASPTSIHSNSNHLLMHSFKYESKIKTDNTGEDIVTTKLSHSPLHTEASIETSSKKKKKSIASSSPPTAPLSPMASNSIPTPEIKPTNPSLFASIFSSSMNASNSTSNSDKINQNVKQSVSNIQNTTGFKRNKFDGSIDNKKKIKKSSASPEPIFKTKSAAKDYSDSKPIVKKVRRKKNEINANDLTNGVLSLPVNHPNMTPLQNGYINTNSLLHSTTSQSTINGFSTDMLTNERNNTTNHKKGSEQPNNEYDVPQTLEQLLERQWAQGSQFIIDQAQHFDIASLLSCLHQLRSENNRLEERVRELISRRDHLLAVNARLTAPANNVFPINGALNTFNSNNMPMSGQSASPVSAHSALSAASSPRTHTNSPSEIQNKSIRVSSPAQSASPSIARSHPSFSSFHNNNNNNDSIGLTNHLFSNISQSYPSNCVPTTSSLSGQSSPTHSQSYFGLPSHSQSFSCIRKANGSDKR
ncbi:protein AF-10-like isoform X2 [Oppia nitens]|uniref:protein AF-10-like isoform X2 n=1 Tax=Oppia nitens TaxID=1686743 RepID=UPI0023DA965D|nr:protein AF-10-like isoform X2 [Oppia nitens]